VRSLVDGLHRDGLARLDEQFDPDAAGTERGGVEVPPRGHRGPAPARASGDVELAVLGEASDEALAVVVVPKGSRPLDHRPAGHWSTLLVGTGKVLVVGIR
jgi:hypothetical protein